MIHRYLLFFGYNGAKFNGVQRQLKRIPYHLSFEDPSYHYRNCLTIAGAIETVLFYLKPANEPVINISSRTDAGVHAFNNAATVDLIHPIPGKYYSPVLITTKINNHLNRLGLDIKINKTLAVGGDFNSRWAEKRSYIYRLALLSHESFLTNEENSPLKSPSYPFHSFSHTFEEYKRKSRPEPNVYPSLPQEIKDNYTLVRDGDVDRLKAGVEIFNGCHNFASFVKSKALLNKHIENGFSTESFVIEDYIHRCVRELKVSIRDIEPPYSISVQSAFQHFRFVEILFESESFLQNQIRRIVGAIVAYSQGQIHLDTLYWMLRNPHPHNWKNFIKVCGSSGLHFVGPVYSEDVIKTATDDVRKLPLESISELPPPKIIDYKKEPRILRQNFNLDLLLSKIDFYHKKQLMSRKKEIESLKLKPTKCKVKGNDGSVTIENRTGEIIETLPDEIYGFVPDHNPDLSVAEIVENKLFLGGQDVAMDFDTIKKYKITHILNVATGVPNLYLDYFTYKDYALLDVPEFLINFLDPLNYIEDAIHESPNHRVYVHCNAGVSRAVTIILAYLMKEHGWTLHQAYTHVKEKRPSMNPNNGFMKQLRRFEVQLFNESQVDSNCSLKCCLKRQIL